MTRFALCLTMITYRFDFASMNSSTGSSNTDFGSGFSSRLFDNEARFIGVVEHEIKQQQDLPRMARRQLPGIQATP